MDTSKEYIKMFEQAGEIQEQRKKWQWSDFYCETPIEWLDKGKLPAMSIALSIKNKRYENETWLPRQDQLQKMISQKFFNYRMFISNFDYFCREEMRSEDFDSMEAYWLAFVMEQQFLKHWTGESWEPKEAIK